MKKTLLLFCLSVVSTSIMAQDVDSTGLEGDNLDLNAVLEVFKDSESPEDFEKKLNSESTNVNNLDLNEDGEVDYIRVIDSGDSTSHALTLQVPVTESESQDVAVIELEEVGKDEINAQIVGDEELYGANYIFVPQEKSGSVTVVNVYGWKPVRHMYGPKYVFWVSPWRYRHHPKWYRPWKRVRWGVYHGRVMRHHGHCRRVHARHFNHAHTHHYHHTHSNHFHKTHHHKHAKTGAKSSPSKSGAGKTKTAPKSTAAPKKSATPKKASPQPNERKRPGAANDQSKPASRKSTSKKKSSGTRPKASPKSKTSGTRGGRKRN